jgi:hypothetical protein
MSELYVFGLILTLLLAMIVGSSRFAGDDEKRFAARIAFLSLVWPVLAVYGIGIGLGRLWKLADWKGAK